MTPTESLAERRAVTGDSLLDQLGVPTPRQGDAHLTMTESWATATYEVNGELIVRALRLDDMPVRAFRRCTTTTTSG